MKNKRLDKEIIKKIILGDLLKGEIVEEKKGTSGIVYIVDLGKNACPRYVAYKTIEMLEGKIDKKKLNKFVREARVWFKLKGYALIITPFYINYFGNTPLICMPFCDTDLESYLKGKNQLDLIETLVFTAQILKALIFAEEKGITAHQDLKPGNILLEDLRKKSKDFCSEDVDKSMKFEVRLADFGLANAWKEIGKPQGSFPYMAPEQYTPDKYKTFKPDIFATGVMMVEMLMGVHPCGKRTKRAWGDWNDKKWEHWAKDGERKVKIGTDEVSKDLESLIRRMLLPNPDERPHKEQVLNEVMDILLKLNKSTATQLKLLFEYYDIDAGYYKEETRLRALFEISQLPNQLDIVINELLEEISTLEKSIDTPREAVYFCELCYRTSKLLLKRRKGGDGDKVRNFAERIISEAIKWEGEIKAHHKYHEEKSEVVASTVRDFEAYAELVNYGKELLEGMIGKERTKTFFEEKGRRIKSAYFYCIAGDLYLKGELTKAIEILNKCIELNPEEALFYYIRASQTEDRLQKMEASKKLGNRESQELKESMLQDVKKALQIAPDWEAPKRFYEKYSKEEK